MGTVFHSVWSDFGDFSMRFFNAGPCANPGAPLARTEALLLRLHCNASPTRSPPSIATQHLPPRGTNYCCFSGAFRVCGESEALLFEASRTQAPLKRNSSPPPIRGRWREAPEGALCEPRRCWYVFIATPRQLAAPLLSLRDIFPQGGTNYCCFSGAFRVCGESEASHSAASPGLSIGARGDEDRRKFEQKRAEGQREEHAGEHHPFDIIGGEDDR